jgi:hypothetical protein
MEGKARRVLLAAGGAASASSRLRIVALAAFIGALPLAYWWQDLRSQLARQRVLEAKLSALREEDNRGQQDIAQLQGKLRRAEAAVASSQPSAAPSEPPNPYVWDESSDFVRIPKSLISRLSFSEVDNNPRQPPLAKDGTPASALVDALRLTAQQAEQLRALCRDAVAQYSNSVLPRCYYLTNAPGRNYSRLAQSPPTEFQRTNRDSVTWVMPSLGEEGEAMRRHVDESLLQLIGEERSAAFSQHVTNQFVEAFHDFGRYRKEFTLYRVGPTEVRLATQVALPQTSGGWIRFYGDEIPEALRPFAEAWQNPAPESSGQPQPP